MLTIWKNVFSTKGAGKRDGKGTCECHKGYIGDLCDQCSIGYYNESNSCIGGSLS